LCNRTAWLSRLAPNWNRYLLEWGLLRRCFNTMDNHDNDGISRPEIKRDVFEGFISEYGKGFVEPLLSYIKEQCQNPAWCDKALFYLTETSPVSEYFTISVRLETIGFIAQWNRSRNPTFLVEFSIMHLTALIKIVKSINPNVPDSQLLFERARTCVHSCLNILSLTPSKNSIHFLEETAFENEGNEFGATACEYLKLANLLRQNYPHYMEH
jgi:hypothetical protein